MAWSTLIHCWGLDTIRWQSRKLSVCFLRDLTIGAPRVRLGTKWPSCRWQRFHLLIVMALERQSSKLSMILHSESSMAKSAERIEGEMIVSGLSLLPDF